MRLLLLTNDFPNPCQPTNAVFNLELARALARRHEVRVIAPVAWVDEWRTRRCNPGLSYERLARIDGIEVYHPRYYYPPKVFRRLYGWFLWRSVRGTVWHLLKSYAPQAVLGY